jgi:hypothetical protein
MKLNAVGRDPDEAATLVVDAAPILPNVPGLTLLLH